MAIPVSVVILTKNEEAGIEATISHLQDFHEVIVVDSGSTDKTIDLATSAGARVVKFAWNGRYPKKKQWSLDNSAATHDWVLLLDADEYPSRELVEEIRDLTRTGDIRKHTAYDIRLQYKFAGKFLRHGHRVTKRSLLRRTRTHFPEVEDLDAPGIREVEGHYQPQTAGPIGTLRSPLMHDDRDPVSSWFERHNRYSEWEAFLRTQSTTRREIANNRSGRGRLFDRVPFKPGAFFVYGYLIRMGFLDGQPGFDYHFALAAYYWQIGLKTRELRFQNMDERHAGNA